MIAIVSWRIVGTGTTRRQVRAGVTSKPGPSPPVEGGEGLIEVDHRDASSMPSISAMRRAARPGKGRKIGGQADRVAAAVAGGEVRPAAGVAD